MLLFIFISITIFSFIFIQNKNTSKKLYPLCIILLLMTIFILEKWTGFNFEDTKITDILQHSRNLTSDKLMIFTTQLGYKYNIVLSGFTLISILYFLKHKGAYIFLSCSIISTSLVTLVCSCV